MPHGVCLIVLYHRTFDATMMYDRTFNATMMYAFLLMNFIHFSKHHMQHCRMQKTAFTMPLSRPFSCRGGRFNCAGRLQWDLLCKRSSIAVVHVWSYIIVHCMVLWYTVI
jgi:hypothetical protein